MPKYRDGWKPHKLCKPCQLIKDGDETLFKRVATSRQYLKGGESLRAIAADYTGKFEYQSLYNHARKHQAPSSEDLVVARVNAQQAKIDGQTYKSIVQGTDKRSALLNKLDAVLQDPEEFEKLETKDKIAFLLKALKDTDDVKAKQKDQEIDILKMMMPARSGEFFDAEDEEDFDPWNKQ